THGRAKALAATTRSSAGRRTRRSRAAWTARRRTRCTGRTADRGTLARVGGRLGALLSDHALPPARTVLDVRVIRRGARAVDVARRFGRRCAVEFLDVDVRQIFMRPRVVGAVVVRRRQIGVAVWPRPEEERRADEDHRAAAVTARPG